jgi:membrane associated rhomboid family serine protease
MGPEPDGAFQLLAEPIPAPRIASEIQAYIAEKPAPVVPLPELPTYPARPLVCLLWVLSLVLVFRWQTADPTLADRAASSSIGLFADGEWWRPFTALFLHADRMHLAGNVITGSCFALLVARSLGAWRGWLLILVAGVLGNLATSWIAWPEVFVSLGASTAVFGALGILSGHGLGSSLRLRKQVSLAVIAAPLTAGIVLLGFLGGGGDPQTDVLGHCNGFAAGVVLGSLAALADQRHA